MLKLLEIIIPFSPCEQYFWPVAQVSHDLSWSSQSSYRIQRSWCFSRVYLQLIFRVSLSRILLPLPLELAYQLQLSLELQASMHSSRWDMMKESSKWPLHLYAWWQSRAGQLKMEIEMCLYINSWYNISDWHDLSFIATPFKETFSIKCSVNEPSPLYSHFLSTDTIRADCATRVSWFSAVFKCQAEGLSWLPGPPFAAVYLAAEGVAALGIVLLAEVDGIFLWGKENIFIAQQGFINDSKT